MAEALLELFAKAVGSQSKGDLPAAMNQINTLLMQWPDFPAAWNNRGAILQKLGHPFDAILNYNRFIDLAPDAAEGYNNRGSAYFDLEQFDRALEDYDRAIARNQTLPEPWNNRGNALMRMGLIKDAQAAYRASLKVEPDYVDGHLGLSLSSLKLGEFEEGWREFEWRWKTKQMAPRQFRLPIWQGGAAKSKDDVLLLYGEQGLGDDIQFMRYAPLAKQAWQGKVILETRYPLTRIAKTLQGIDGVVTFGEKFPGRITAVAAVLSLPYILWQRLQEIPSACPYLYPDPYRASIWREKMKALPAGYLIGICWAGMRREGDPGAESIDSRRSMHLGMFAPLTKIKGISWVSLQLGAPSSQLYNAPPGMTIGDWTSDIYDFYDTAALIEPLDLVITVDTSVAHIAGATGKKVWLLSRFDSCWRWLIDRDDTSWYPNMKIYRQQKPYDWDEVLQRMAEDLNRGALGREMLGRMRPTLVASA